MIDCVSIADRIKEELKPLVSINKKLAIICVGDNPASKLYVRNKMNDAKELGVPVLYYQYGEDVTNDELLLLIDMLNKMDDVKGIIIQLPLPEHLDTDLLVNAIDDSKDIDGFKPSSKYTPCTPKGIMTILDSLDMNLAGKTATILGKGRTVGRPLIDLLLDRGVTVTICHSRSKKDQINRFVYHSDIVISAVGKPGLVNKENVLNHYEELPAWIPDKVIIDVGISRDENGKQIGDCEKELRNYVENITGYTNSVGLMTRMSLFQNLLMD